MAQPFQIFQGQVEPVATYPVTVKGTAFPLTACSVTFSMRPYGSTTPTVSHAAAIIQGDPLLGVVEYDWAIGDTATAGTYAGWFTITLPNGKPQDTPEFEVEVLAHATLDTSALVTLNDTLDAMRLTNQLKGVSENDQQLIRSLIVSASQLCEEYTSRRFSQVAATARTYTYDGFETLDLGPWDLRSATQVQIDTDVSPLTLDPTSQYRFEPRNAPYGVYTHLLLQPFSVGPSRLNFWEGGGSIFGAGVATFGRQVTVTGDWGWATVPEPIKQGVKVLVARWFANPVGAQIIRQGTTDMQFTRGGAGGGGKGGVGDDLPEEVTSMWKPFVRPGIS